ncbi:uncharacterized protein SOCE836_017260 [Sorangium cellulosum]|uniref:Uncharacterized protein n=1 Tax=Sorangium cellulosum TaxID=56 RepID=A0A4P2QIC2_SORCE|nr:uncharacterized protein SOCE836_017260 [Sorangium cellulosum]WCQ89024.1 hypothetical protein NQZ70_01709 [Sorangium sp. Soce836]
MGQSRARWEHDRAVQPACAESPVDAQEHEGGARPAPARASARRAAPGSATLVLLVALGASLGCAAGDDGSEAHAAPPGAFSGQAVARLDGAFGGQLVPTRLGVDGASAALAFEAGPGAPRLSHLSWAAAGSMTRPRFNHRAVRLLDGRVLLIDGDGGVGSTEFYDPATDTFAPAGAMTDDRSAFGVTLLADGRVLVTSGYSWTSRRIAAPVDTAEVFDPASNTWTAVASLPHWRAGHDAPLLADGRVVIPGADGVQFYDPIADTWTVGAAPVIEGCCDTATLLPSGKILVTATNLYDTNQAAIYDPTDDTWSPAAEMGEGNDYEATLLPDGRVLAVAVYGMADRNVEVYDPAADRWSFVPGLPNTLRAPRDAEGRVNLPLQERAVTVLQDGRVLVSGGMEEFYENCAPWGDCYYNREYSNATYLYDPSTDRWTAGPSLSVERSGHSATALLDGSVLIAGGTVPPAPYMYGEISASAERLFVGGAPCGSSAECATGFCVDGVCCTSACDAGPCDACSIAAGAAIEGECTLLTGPACDDANACTEADSCDDGICSGVPSDAGACATGAGGAGGAGDGGAGGAGGSESTAASTSAGAGGAGDGGAGGAGGGESTAASTSAGAGGAGSGGEGGGEPTAASTSAGTGGAGVGGEGGGESTAASTSAGTGGAGGGESTAASTSAGTGGAGGGESTAASTSAGAGTGSDTPVTAGSGCNFGETRSISAPHIGLVALFSLARLTRRRRLASSPSPEPSGARRAPLARTHGRQAG